MQSNEQNAPSTPSSAAVTSSPASSSPAYPTTNLTQTASPHYYESEAQAAVTYAPAITQVPPAATRRVSGGRPQRSISSLSSISASPSALTGFDELAPHNYAGMSYNEVYSQQQQQLHHQQQQQQQLHHQHHQQYHQHMASASPTALSTSQSPSIQSMSNQPPSTSTAYPVSYGMSGSYVAATEKLRQDLELEQMENQNLDRQLRETRKKLENALQLQSQLENDVVDMAKEVGNLQTQLKDFKKIKRDLENELSQEQVTNVNEKQQWLDKEQQYEKTIAKLKEENTKLKESSDHSAKGAAASNTGSHHHKIFSINGFANLMGGQGAAATAAAGAVATSSSAVPTPVPASSSTSNKDRIIERLKSELEQLHQQTELVSREYALRHDHIENELQQQKNVVGRLMEENEGFQYLLAEKAILGGFAVTNEVVQRDESRAASTSSASSSSSSTTDKIKNLPQVEIHSGNSLADELDRISLASADEDYDDTLTSDTSPELKKRMNDLEFEAQSLRNHNKALQLSLERLVQRLLEFKEFENEVETSTMSGNINAQAISQFQTRLARDDPSSNATNGRPRLGRTNSITSVASGGAIYPGMKSAAFLASAGANGDSPRHGPRDSVSSTHSSLYGLGVPYGSSSVGSNRSGRQFKNPVLWNSMLLGGPGAMGGATNSSGSSLVNGAVGPNARNSGRASNGSRSSSSSFMPLSIDGDSSPSSASSDSGSSSSGSGSDRSSHRSESPSRSRSSSRSSFRKPADIATAVLNGTILSSASSTSSSSSSRGMPRRPSITSQRGFIPLSMARDT